MPQTSAVGLLNLPMNYRRRCSGRSNVHSRLLNLVEAESSGGEPRRLPLTSQQINWACRPLAWSRCHRPGLTIS